MAEDATQDVPAPPVSSEELIRAARDAVGMPGPTGASASTGSMSEQMLRAAREQVAIEAPEPLRDWSAMAPTAEEPAAPGTMEEPPKRTATTTPTRAEPRPPRSRSAPPPPRRSSAPAPPTDVVIDPTGTSRRRVPRLVRGLVPLVIFGIILLSNFFGGADEVPDAVPVSVTAATQAPEAVEARADEPSVNLALRRSVTASGSTADRPASNAVDGAPATAWNSGGYPPQWIGIDLGGPATVREVRLRVGQNPTTSPTVHGVFGNGPGTDGEWLLLHEFVGTTSDSTWISAKPDVPWSGIESVRVLTVESPSWVSWFEIEVLGVRE